MIFRSENRVRRRKGPRWRPPSLLKRNSRSKGFLVVTNLSSELRILVPCHFVRMSSAKSVSFSLPRLWKCWNGITTGDVKSQRDLEVHAVCLLLKALRHGVQDYTRVSDSKNPGARVRAAAGSFVINSSSDKVALTPLWRRLKKTFKEDSLHVWEVLSRSNSLLNHQLLQLWDERTTRGERLQLFHFRKNLRTIDECLKSRDICQWRRRIHVDVQSA